MWGWQNGGDRECGGDRERGGGRMEVRGSVVVTGRVGVTERGKKGGEGCRGVSCTRRQRRDREVRYYSHGHCSRELGGARCNSSHTYN